MTFRKLLQSVKLPIIQAPMAGVNTPQMAISACNSGIVGSIGCGMMEPASIKGSIEKIRNVTDKPFNINLFIVDNMDGYQPDRVAIKWLDDVYAERGLELPNPSKFAPKFEDQFAVLLEQAPPIASFAFGILDVPQVRNLHDRKIAVVGAATSLEEALQWESVGADACVIQGIEAGGHRCSFINTDDPGQPLSELLESVKNHLNIPLIAAGGLMNGGDVQAVLSAGADYAQLGTVFLMTDESPIPQAYRDALYSSRGDDTTLTKGFSGRLARGIRNKFIEQSSHQYSYPYPVQNAFTQPLRKDAAQRNSSDGLSMWSGKGVEAVKDSSSIESLVRRLEEEYYVK
ncbi:reductase [Wallemia mellicola]|nr:reductase [Wallemia mellicola]